MAKADYPKSTKIEDLVEIQSMESGDYFLTYSKEGKASLLNFKNLIIGLANVSFALTFNDLIARVSALEVGLAGLTNSVTLMDARLSSATATNLDRIIALEATVAANFTSLSSQINTINATLTNHTTRIVGLEQTVSKLSTLDVTGMVIALAGNTVPADWIICDGRELSRSTYARLFAVIGTLYGGGNGTSTFNVPNLNGRTIVQKDNGSNVAPEASALGTIGGLHDISLTGAQNGPHRHLQASAWVTGDPIDGIDLGVPLTPDHVLLAWHNDSDDGAHLRTLNVKESPYPNREPDGVRTSTDGLGQAHSNMQPFMTMQFIIRT